MFWEIPWGMKIPDATMVDQAKDLLQQLPLAWRVVSDASVAENRAPEITTGEI